LTRWLLYQGDICPYGAENSANQKLIPDILKIMILQIQNNGPANSKFTSIILKINVP